MMMARGAGTPNDPRWSPAEIDAILVGNGRGHRGRTVHPVACSPRSVARVSASDRLHLAGLHSPPCPPGRDAYAHDRVRRRNLIGGATACAGVCRGTTSCRWGGLSSRSSTPDGRTHSLDVDSDGLPSGPGSSRRRHDARDVPVLGREGASTVFAMRVASADSRQASAPPPGHGACMRELGGASRAVARVLQRVPAFRCSDPYV